MKQDKFLIGIVAGVIVLAIVALVVIMFRAPGQQSYQSEDTPAGVAHNYFLAIQQEDYQRAYDYLSDDLPNKPSLDEFISEVNNNRGGQESILDVEDTLYISDTRAQVTLSITRYSMGGLFDSNRYTNQENGQLTQNANGQWKITQFPYPYWGWNWNDEPGS
jgi:hypothetical protein